MNHTPLLRLAGTLLVSCLVLGSSAYRLFVPHSKPIRRTLSAKSIIRASGARKGEDAILLILPVKRTSDPGPGDLDLAVYVLGRNNKPTFLGAEPGSVAFNREVANYVHYMHENQVKSADVPQGYSLHLSGDRLTASNTVVIGLDIFARQWAGLTVSTDQVFKAGWFTLDSPGCKCPPGPCIDKVCIASVFAIVRSDYHRAIVKEYSYVGQ